MTSICIPFSLAVIPTSHKSVIFIRNCDGVHSADSADSADSESGILHTTRAEKAETPFQEVLYFRCHRNGLSDLQ
jgi:hypothetical protein